jgi:tRNA-2-methylthio-N6-dimethylallyladenosine synthase
MPRVFLKTYGCQMNVRDSEQVAQQLLAKGYTLTDEERSAEVVLYNTCSVRDMAEQKAVDRVVALRGLKKKRPGMVIGLLGCMAQSRQGELLDQLPELDLVVGTQKFHEAATYVDRLWRNQEGGRRRERLVDTEAQTDSQNTIRDHVLAPQQVTAFVSIMQGCNMHCTFCIVPSTRGSERSRPLEEIVQEVSALAERGLKEVTLLGQIVNLYGRHEFPTVNGESPFVQLLRAVSAVPGIQRVRFFSPHPIGFREDLIRALKEVPQLCEQVHLPLQSGSNRILKAMHRGYTAEKYLDLVARLRSEVPGVTISTDIIVGFPGETEADFKATEEVLRRADFDQAFIFRYSPRRETPAATMDGQMEEPVKLARNQRLLAVLDEIVAKKSNALVGQEQEILVEGESKNNALRFQGRTRGNHLVMVEANERWRGQILPVRIIETTGFTYYAEPLLAGL